MRSCIVLGAGRSGTSVLAGTLASAGYFMGNDLLPPTEGNPKGYFEDREINRINEEILRDATPQRPPFFGRWLFRDRPRRNQRWLARVEPGTPMVASPKIRTRVEAVIPSGPYCFKDPRFSYTLPVWRPYLSGDPLFICVFRHPSLTAQSVLTEIERERYLSTIRLSFRQALDVWVKSYRHVLEIHAGEGDWLFLHFDQVVGGSAYPLLERLLHIRVDSKFPDSDIPTTREPEPIGDDAAQLYRQLCSRAGYSEGVG